MSPVCFECMNTYILLYNSCMSIKDNFISNFKTLSYNLFKLTKKFPVCIVFLRRFLFLSSDLFRTIGHVLQ